MLVLAAILIGLCVYRLVSLCLLDCYGYADKEAYRTIGVTESKNLRGTIYDCNKNTLAYSTYAYNVILSPYDIYEIEQENEYNEIINSSKSSADDIKEAKNNLERLKLNTGDKAMEIARVLSSAFPDDVDYAKLLENMKTKAYQKGSSYYYCVLRHIDASEKESIEMMINHYNTELDNSGRRSDSYIKISILDDLYFENTQKRVYPYASTGSIFLGYVSKYDNPNGGIESYYDTQLEGIASRRITGKGVSGIVTSLYDKTYEGVDSMDIVSTVDIKIQEILEKEMANVENQTHAQAVQGVVLNTKTGEVLAIGSTPGYDANDPYSATEVEKNYYNYLVEEAYENATAGLTLGYDEDGNETDAKKQEEKIRDEIKKEIIPSSTDRLNNRIRNRSIDYYYYPGSTYKAFLVAGATEEGMKIDYNCATSWEIPNSTTGSGGNRIITCAYGNYHGMNLDGRSLLVNSCNICAAQLGIDMGSDTFFKYYQAFGFTEATGVDLPGGSTPPSSLLYYSTYKTFDIATCSFGQNNAVTTMQLAVAMSAIGNGGYIMKPYIVSELLDSEGNVTQTNEPEIKRQAISTATASTLNSFLESVVSDGSGSGAKLKNYRVSGKTGTSQLKDANENTIGYVTTFAGFAPSSDPEITVVVTVYDPLTDTQGGGNLLASAIAAPLAGTVIEQTLEHLGVPYDKTAE